MSIFGRRESVSASPNGAGHARLDTAGLESVADEVAQAAARYREGTAGQLLRVEGAVARTGTIVRSLEETAQRADAVATAGEQLASSVNQMAASIEEITAN